jgi:hypothetical protein
MGLGLYLAWGSKNSVLFVAAGALLLVIGLVGADWREIVAKIGDNEITVRRAEQVVRAANEVEELARRFDELVERVDTQPDVVEAIKDEVRRQTAAIRSDARSIAGGISFATTPPASGLTIGSTGTAFSVGPSYRATAAVSPTHVELALERQTSDYGGGSFEPFLCTVTAPDGTTWTAGDPTKFTYTVGSGAGRVATYRYPADFGSARTLPGTYRVQWTRKGAYGLSIGLGTDDLASTTFTLAPSTDGASHTPARKAAAAKKSPSAPAKKITRKPSV